MQNQGKSWEREYRNPVLMTGDDKPQSDTLHFLKYLKKEEKYKVEDRNVLDLGSGTGRNSNYLAEMGNKVIGIEISSTALKTAINRAKTANLEVDYRLGDIGAPYDIANNSIDIILDITSSNSLNEKGREIYLNEMHRVLKSGGYIFVRALCKDGNANVKKLLKISPGGEYDTYYMKDLDLVERVFSKKDIIDMYSKYFKILKLEKKTGYAKVAGRIYKRDYWLMYLKSR
jgi:SAM-dependent methyltransferase